MSETILNVKQLGKSFADEVETVHVLHDVSMNIVRGDRIAIIGPSGSGKSTLLHLLAGLEQPTTGEVEAFGHSWFQLSEKQRCQLRNRHFGFVYQFHHLLPEFTAYENVAMPCLLAGQTLNQVHTRVLDVLNAVGLSHRIEHRPAQLSGGERQRVAIARALIHNPACLLADEPTGNLDTSTAAHVFQLMLDLNQHNQSALVIVTHDRELALRMDQQWTLMDGKLIEVTREYQTMQ